MDEVELDTSGMRCPLPILEMARALRDLPAGTRLRIIATDPAFETDLAAFCEAAGHELLSVEVSGRARWVGQIRKGRNG